MTLAPMTEAWVKQLREHLTKQKEAGLDAPTALRAAEIMCGKNSEEFASGGRELVEEVYGGVFSAARGGAGVVFTPHRIAPKVDAAVEEMKALVGELNVGVDIPDRIPAATAAQIEAGQKIEAARRRIAAGGKPPKKPAKHVASMAPTDGDE